MRINEKCRIIARKEFVVMDMRTLPIVLETFIQKLAERGITTIAYSEAEKILKKHNLLALTSVYTAFTYFFDNSKIIFYSDELSYIKKVEVIAHEFGHIAMNHTVYNNLAGHSKDIHVQNIFEEEANNFAIEFQAPVPALMQYQYNSVEMLVDLAIFEQADAQIQINYYHEYLNKSLVNFNENTHISKSKEDKSVNLSVYFATVITILVAFFISKLL